MGTSWKDIVGAVGDSSKQIRDERKSVEEASKLFKEVPELFKNKIASDIASHTYKGRREVGKVQADAALFVDAVNTAKALPGIVTNTLGIDLNEKSGSGEQTYTKEEVQQMLEANTAQSNDDKELPQLPQAAAPQEPRRMTKQEAVEVSIAGINKNGEALYTSEESEQMAAKIVEKGYADDYLTKVKSLSKERDPNARQETLTEIGGFLELIMSLLTGQSIAPQQQSQEQSQSTSHHEDHRSPAEVFKDAAIEHITNQRNPNEAHEAGAKDDLYAYAADLGISAHKAEKSVIAYAGDIANGSVMTPDNVDAAIDKELDRRDDLHR